MNETLDLSIETLDRVEAPLTDREWGLLAGVAFMGGVLLGIT